VRILCLSDSAVSFINSPQIRHVFGGADLVLACGDLASNYLENVVSWLNVPMVYVPGNHDSNLFRVDGALAADGQLVEVGGLRILGLGGSRRYKEEGRHQYTEAQMRWRILRSAPSWLWRSLKGERGMDILLTHAPAYGIHDGADLAHVGFRSFLSLMEWARPQLMVHGHVHILPNLDISESRFRDTAILNVYPYRVVEVSESEGIVVER
jgi:Icc-related predicted phosphoesterase